MSQHFDRQGRPVSLLEWAALFEDVEQRSVVATTLRNGLWVSTVWLGMDHGFGRLPLFFETMVFGCLQTSNMWKRGELVKLRWPVQFHRSREALDQERYQTEQMAYLGHAGMCAKWAKTHGCSWTYRDHETRVPRRLKKRLARSEHVDVRADETFRGAPRCDPGENSVPAVPGRYPA